MNICIDGRLTSAVPAITLGILEVSGVVIGTSSTQLWKALERAAAGVREQMQDLKDVYAHSAIEATRSAYRSLGKDPSRYRGSAEALARRSLSDKPLYRVNNAVDLNNLLSLVTLLPVGSYDRAAIEGDIVFRVGEKGEGYPAIGKERFDLEGLPLSCDARGPFGSPTSDSLRTMIRPETRDLITIIISFGGMSEPMATILDEAATCMRRHLSQDGIQTRVVT
jgi:DNA/RNA-binding domain of Phe-tRNA-synthetase-like protein